MGELKQEFNEKKPFDAFGIFFPPSELQIGDLFPLISSGFLLELMFSSSVLGDSSSRMVLCIDCGQQVRTGKTEVSRGCHVTGQEAAMMRSYYISK